MYFMDTLMNVNTCPLFGRSAYSSFFLSPSLSLAIYDRYKYVILQTNIPSRELRYPTLGTGKSSSNMPWMGICDRSQEGMPCMDSWRPQEARFGSVSSAAVAVSTAALLVSQARKETVWSWGMMATSRLTKWWFENVSNIFDIHPKKLENIFSIFSNFDYLVIGCSATTN